MFSKLLQLSIAVAALAFVVNAWGEEDKRKAERAAFESFKPKVEEKKPEKPPVDRPDFIKPEFQTMPTCAKGSKRVSKGKTGNTRALMTICGGWCIGRSPGAKEWIAEDLPYYAEQQVGTIN